MLDLPHYNEGIWENGRAGVSGATNAGDMQFWQIRGSRALTAQRSLKKMKKVKTQLMSLLKAYLRTHRVQRALSLKPG